MTPVFNTSTGILFYIAAALLSIAPFNVHVLVNAFVPTTKFFKHRPIHNNFLEGDRRIGISKLRAMNRNKNGDSFNSYDLSKPMYDLYSFRMVRGDALTKYNLRNQSEPLRINLAIIGALFFLSIPSLISELSGASGSATVIPTTVPYVSPQLSVTMTQTVGSWIGAIGCCFFGVQQAMKRNKQLLRIEKECAACDLQIQLPMTWIGSERPFQVQAESTGSIIKNKSCRVLALSGPSNTLQDILQNELRVYNRRWVQSNTYWVLVPTDKGITERSRFTPAARYPWLAQASDLEAWNLYFQNLQAASTTTSSPDDVAWFGLSANGRSFGSGAARPASYVQLFGNHLSPVEVLSDDAPEYPATASTTDAENALLACQRRFYQALTEGNLDVMLQDVFMTKKDPLEYDTSVTAVIQQGGRLDAWESCLMPDAKPTGMTIADPEITVLDDGRTAYTTCIEFPADQGGLMSTLLAVQKWQRTDETYKLVQHQTIPWTSDRRAGGTLLCDSRGCVALVRFAQ